MDDETTQSGLPPGVTRIRLGGRMWEMPDPVWELWVRQGHVPPEALILSQHWSRGVWRKAESLEVYHLFRPSSAGSPSGTPAAFPAPPGVEGSQGGLAGAPVGQVPPPAATGLPIAIWGPGVSVTQILVLVNLVVSACLVFFWRDQFSDNLWAFSGRLRAALNAGWIPVLVIPLFLHASAGHLMGNMVGLAAGGAAVEEFYGPARTALLYLAAGLSGACLSLLRHNPVLSVGASGAIMGLYGVVLVFLLRYRSSFSERQRFKTSRVYLPLLVLALLPSLFMADVYSHLGGFAGGVLAALFLAPSRARLPWLKSGGGPAHQESLDHGHHP